MVTERTGKNAVVIGASIAGLFAARVLADHFEQVILLERDPFPATGGNRKGVPQGKHTHVLLERGRQTMEGYLPGMTDELIRLGAVHIPDASTTVRWFHSGGYHKPGVSGISGIGVARPTLEALIRQCVLRLPNVQVLDERSVVGLVTSDDNRQVRGVYVGNRRSGSEETWLADLVVDASGRGSRSPAWLEALGYGKPVEEEVRVGVGYTTCYFRRIPEKFPDLNGIVFLATPPKKRMGVMLAQDGNRWVVTLGGYLGAHTPADLQSFLESASRLPESDIYNIIKDAEPLSEPVAYMFPANLRRHYEKLDRFPDGYLILGDALCSFNPIYGQGMTVAVLEAEALEECLSTNRGQLAKNFFSKASKIIDLSWSVAVGNDLGYVEVEGPRTIMMRFLNWYIRKLHLAAHTDSRVSIAFLKVINMVSPPSSILHPSIFLRVLRNNAHRFQAP